MTTRDQILDATGTLLENQGYNATGLNEIVRESGAPKGSLYYYFPQGKDEIVSEAVILSGERVSERIRSHLAEFADAGSALQSFIEIVAHYVEASGFRAGGPLTIVASETASTNERINLACREAYSMLKMAFQEKLVACGYETAQADRLALVILSAMEGGIMLSRTFHSGDPLRLIARQIPALLACPG